MPEIKASSIRWCRYCGTFEVGGIIPGRCSFNTAGEHVVTDGDENAGPTGPQAATETESPIERFIALIAQGNLIREEAQTDSVPLLRRAEVVAQLYQAQALQQIARDVSVIREIAVPDVMQSAVVARVALDRIAGELAVIREALKGLPDALAAIERVGECVSDYNGESILNTWDNSRGNV